MQIDQAQDPSVMDQTLPRAEKRLKSVLHHDVTATIDRLAMLVSAPTGIPFALQGLGQMAVRIEDAVDEVVLAIDSRVYDAVRIVVRGALDRELR